MLMLLGVMVASVMVMNLIKRHPNCRVLLHRSNTEGKYMMKAHPF